MKLLQLLEAYDKERPTNDDMLKLTEKLVSMLQKRMDGEKEELTGAAKRIAEEFSNLRSQIDSSMTEKDARLNETERATLERLEAKMAEFEALIKQRLAELKDGMDADEEIIYQRLTERIPAPIPGSPDTAEDVRNKLELLEGDERLKIEAIKDLREELDELKKRGGTTHVIGHSSGGGRIVKVYDLSASLDGVTTTFALPAFWRVLTVDLSSFPNALRPTVDFTTDASAMTITFTSEIDPATSLATGQTCIITYSE